ncbi:MAG: SDR family NAD(P)-dependent oxidoreductase [Arthrobacter sp.]|uniref:SDR family NAD(P)-dependent oxidoreductase n=1 Tax=unclassified Arthrobacter TaxID=235627 RepID=UPI00264DC708|nr:SDR family oxidoreductase [Micrococcaceae bacterium]
MASPTQHPETHYSAQPTVTALITGATSGLGAEFARQLAAQGYSLVLVARDQQRLDATAESLSARYAVQVQTISADLVTEAGVQQVANRLADSTNPVTTLVNNAGYGMAGNFADNDLAEELAHVGIHVRTPLILSHAALRAMAKIGGGRIINVASVAAFTPRGTYSASKAFLVNFSRWANVFYHDRGISVTAICPGFVHTEFHDRMKIDKKSIPSWSWLEPEEVVRSGLTDAMAGRSVSIPSTKYKIITFLARVAPDALVARLAQRGR